MGELRMVEVYVNYDGPRLFSCRNAAGTYFFGLFVDEDARSETFLFAPASPARWASVRAGNLPLAAAFRQPEDNGVFRQILALDEEPSTHLDWLPVDEVPEDWYPDESARLTIPTDTQPPLEEYEFANESRSLMRSLMAVEVDVERGLTEIPSRHAANTLRLVQESVEALGQVRKNRQTNRGAIQADILDETELYLYDLRAASFAFVLSPRPTGQLFETSLVPAAVNLLLDVMEASESDELLSEQLRALHPRALSRYRALLEELTEFESGLTVLMATPDREVRKTVMSKEQVRSSLDAARLTEEPVMQTIEIDAVLIGVNARTRSFELIDEESGIKYAGKTVDSARNRILGLRIGDRYDATLLHESEVSPITGETHDTYRLVHIEPIAPPTLGS